MNVKGPTVYRKKYKAGFSKMYWERPVSSIFHCTMVVFINPCRQYEHRLPKTELVLTAINVPGRKNNVTKVIILIETVSLCVFRAISCISAVTSCIFSLIRVIFIADS